MSKKYVHKSKYFYGNEISEYGLKYGYIDYRTLAKCGDMVLCNEITKLFYGSINGQYSDVEQVNGWIDNQDAIDEMQVEIDELQEKLDDLEYNKDLDDCVAGNIEQQENELQEKIDELQEKIDELQQEQYDQDQDIYQYYIIDDNLARILKELTNEIVYYIPSLDIYVWGITHYGTSWDYVLTDIAIDLGGE